MSEKTTINVGEIQLRLARGDQAGLKLLYGHYNAKLYQFAFAIVNSRETAEEIVADVFLQIWNRRERVSTLENLNWYLFITTRNISFNYLRKINRKKNFDFDDAFVAQYQVQATPEEIMIGREMLMLVNRVINDLPPKCRLIFKLVKEDDLKYREVAELLNLSVKTVENQVGLAFKRIHAVVRQPVAAVHLLR